MMNKNDMSGKLGNIKKMRIVVGLFTVVALSSLSWILAFYFLYPSWETGHTAMCWQIFLGLVLPFCWPIALLCGILSIFLPANAVLVLTTAMMLIVILLVLRAVCLPDPRSYGYLTEGIQIEKWKSLIFGTAVSLLYFVEAGNQCLLVYGACLIYQIIMLVNFLLCCFYAKLLHRMDYREIFGTDWKDPYGQA